MNEANKGLSYAGEETYYYLKQAELLFLLEVYGIRHFYGVLQKKFESPSLEQVAGLYHEMHQNHILEGDHSVSHAYRTLMENIRDASLLLLPFVGEKLSPRLCAYAGRRVVYTQPSKRDADTLRLRVMGIPDFALQLQEDGFFPRTELTQEEAELLPDSIRKDLQEVARGLDVQTMQLDSWHSCLQSMLVGFDPQTGQAAVWLGWVSWKGRDYLTYEDGNGTNCLPFRTETYLELMWMLQGAVAGKGATYKTSL